MLDDNQLLSVSVELTPAERALMVKYGHPLSQIEAALRAVASSRAIETVELSTFELDLEVERSAESYAKRKEADAKRREKAQEDYVEDFTGAVVTFLAFHASHADLAHRLAGAVADHATPVGSGTVARTKRIPVEQRAEAAVIAWMRHQTTAYDSMKIARVKGKRREVRRMLAERSKELLARYRRGESISESCPLMMALGKSDIR